MGVFDKFITAMSLNPDDEDDDFIDDGDYFDDEPDPPRINKRKKPKNNNFDDSASGNRENSKRINKITPIHGQRKTVIDGMEICVIKPKSVDDSREITDTLLSNRPVILDVEGLEIGEAQRIIDFAAGSCYAINGNLQKVTNYMIIISPSSVDISGDLLDIVESDTFQVNGLHMDL